MKTLLTDVPSGGIVRYRGDWGVVTGRGRLSGWRIVDFWVGGRQRVRSWKVVEWQTRPRP